MKKLIMILLSIGALFAIASADEKPLGVEEFSSVGGFAKTIAAYFPRVQGEIASVQEDKITVSIGSDAGLKSGVSLSIWRAGKEIIHPTTGMVLGRMEDEVGDAEVVDVGAAASTVRMIKKLKEPQQGDKVRITPKKISLALLPLKVDRPGIIHELADQLNESGRFSVIGNWKVEDVLRGRKERDSSLIQDLGRMLGAEVVAVIEMYPSEGGKFLVTTRMFYTVDARLFGTFTAMLNLNARQAAFGDLKPFFSSEREYELFFPEGRSFTAEERGATKQLPFDAQLFAAGDLEGNGTIHYVFSDGSFLHIYRREPAGWREEWAETKPFFGAEEIQHINVDVADINGNGKPEIFVTAMQHDKVFSYILEFKDGTYHRIAAIPGFLRVMKYPHKGDMLLGQSYRPDSIFEGKPKQYTWSEGKYAAGPEFPLPRGVGLYGFVIADMEVPNPFLVALNDKDQLTVYSNNKPIWKSEEKYPSVGVTILKPLTGVEASVQTPKMVKDIPFLPDREKIKINGRILALDLNNDGRDEIVLPKNMGIPYLWYLLGYDEAEFAVLSWTGSRLEQRWTIKNIPGVVLDFQALLQPDTNAQILALVNIPGGPFKSDKVQVLSYTTTTTAIATTNTTTAPPVTTAPAPTTK